MCQIAFIRPIYNKFEQIAFEVVFLKTTIYVVETFFYQCLQLFVITVFVITVLFLFSLAINDVPTYSSDVAHHLIEVLATETVLFQNAFAY